MSESGLTHELIELALKGRGSINDVRMRSIKLVVDKVVNSGSCPSAEDLGCVICDYSGVSCEEVSEMIATADD